MLSDVANPRKCLVSTLFHNLQVPYLNTRYGEIRNLKLDGNRCPTFHFVICLNRNKNKRIKGKKKTAPGLYLAHNQTR